MRTLLVASFLVLLAPGFALAQDEGTPPAKVVINVHGIGQGASSTTASTLRFTLYEEEATKQFSQKFGSGAGIWLDGGYRVWRNAFAGAGFSRTSTEGSGSVAMSLPHPLFYEQPRAATHSIDGAKQTVQAVHIWAGWRMRLANRLDVTLSAGPSFVSVKRDVATESEFTEGEAPFTTVTAGSVRTVRRSKSVTGAHVGATIGYALTRQLGVSGALRYVAAKPSIEGASGSAKSSVGGLTFGGGIQVIF